MEFNGDNLIVINFHAMPPGLSLEDRDYWNFFTIIREEQVRELIGFIDNQNIPVIALGDLNATDQNVAYKIMTALWWMHGEQHAQRESL